MVVLLFFILFYLGSTAPSRGGELMRPQRPDNKVLVVCNSDICLCTYTTNVIDTVGIQGSKLLMSKQQLHVTYIPHTVLYKR